MDDEIVIGVELKDEEKNKKGKNKKDKKKSTKKNNKKVNNKQNTTENKDNKKKKQIKKNRINSANKKVKKNHPILKWIGIIGAGLLIIILFLCSPLFNIKKIEVEGNTKVSSEKIISLSSLELYSNLFKFNKNDAENNIKENAYIEKVNIKRELPSTVKISVEEREAKYMLQFADSYVYINNQGYMLEISNNKLDIPILIGFTTDLSNIKAGNRINVEDLKKMDMVIKIYETAKSNDLGNLISKIDISNNKNYTIILDTEGKTVYLGDGSDLNTRILYLKTILEASSGKSGEIFLNVDLNTHNAYFRPSSN